MSVTTIHGRVVTGPFNLDSVQAKIAAAQAVIGLAIARRLRRHDYPAAISLTRTSDTGRSIADEAAGEREALSGALCACKGHSRRGATPLSDNN